jgi:hypothetical protein
MVVRSLLNKGVPPSYINTPIFKEKWLDVVARVAWDTLRTLSVHRNKLLPRLDTNLTNWGTLVGEAGFVDREFMIATGVINSADAPMPADNSGGDCKWGSLWSVQIATALMSCHMGLIVEMELLSVSEIDYFYW